jgi:hypothetical protein
MTWGETFIGNFTVQAQVTLVTYDYSTMPPTGTTTVQTVSCQVTIPPPDGIILPTMKGPPPSPLTFTTNCGAAGTMMYVSFPVTCQGRQINPSGGTPLETVTNRVWGGVDQDDIIQQPGDYLTTEPPYIVDAKGAGLFGNGVFAIFKFRRFEGGVRTVRRVKIPPFDRPRRDVSPGNSRWNCRSPGATEKLGELGEPGFQ